MNVGDLRRDLVSLAKDILSGERDIIDATREMAAILPHLPEMEDPVFDVVRGVASETDGVPTGKARALYADEYLRKVDESMSRFMPLVRGDVLEACAQIVKRYESGTTN